MGFRAGVLLFYKGMVKIFVSVLVTAYQHGHIVGVLLQYFYYFANREVVSVVIHQRLLVSKPCLHRFAKVSAFALWQSG